MEEKDVQRLLDMLYGMIDEAKSVAFSSDKCIIVRDEALDLLDEIRAKLPLELKKAQELIAARSEYVAGAKKEAQEVPRSARPGWPPRCGAARPRCRCWPRDTAPCCGPRPGG